MIRLRASLLQISILAFVAPWGCARDAQAQASPPPGKALIVLYRADRQPVAGKAPVIVNADRLGELGNGEFINAVVNPGRTFLRVGDRILTTLAVQTSANQKSYVLVQAVPGQTPLRVEMRETNEAAARPYLAQGRPAAVGAVAPRAAPAAAVAPRAPAAAPLAVAPAAAPPPRPAPAQPAPPPQRQAQAAPPPKPKPAPPPRARAEPAGDYGPESKWAVIAKTGAFKLTTTDQDIGGLPSTFEAKSKPFAALEVEYRDHAGYALGGEVLYYKNDFTPIGTALKGTQTVVAGTFNVKYYIEATRWLYPFFGVGLGYATSSFGGDFTGKAGSAAFQAMAGADVRFSDSVGLYIEYKYLNAPTRDSNQEIAAGGHGILAGLSFAF